jgi:hypothetical protein
MRYFTKPLAIAAFLIASLASAMAESKPALPACDSEDVTRISRDLLKVFGEYEIIKQVPYNDPDGKQWCYAYYRTMINGGLYHYEAYFTVEWVSQAEGRFAVQFKRGGVAYRADVPPPASTLVRDCKTDWRLCRDNNDLVTNYRAVDMPSICRAAAVGALANAGFWAEVRWITPFALADDAASRRLGDFTLRGVVEARPYADRAAGKKDGDPPVRRRLICHYDLNGGMTNASVTVEREQ